MCGHVRCALRCRYRGRQARRFTGLPFGARRQLRPRRRGGCLQHGCTGGTVATQSGSSAPVDSSARPGAGSGLVVDVVRATTSLDGQFRPRCEACPACSGHMANCAGPGASGAGWWALGGLAMRPLAVGAAGGGHDRKRTRRRGGDGCLCRQFVGRACPGAVDLAAIHARRPWCAT